MRYSLTGPHRRPGRKCYYIRALDLATGKYSWWSTRHTNKDLAKAHLRKLQYDDVSGYAPGVGPGTLFADLLDKFLKEKADTTSEKHAQSLRYMAEKFWIPRFGHFPVRDIRAEDITLYLKERRVSRRRRDGQVHPLSAATINNERRDLAGIFNWAINKDILHRSPLRGVPRLHGEMRKRTRFISREDEERLLEACTNPTTVECLGRRNTGSRRGGTLTDDERSWEMRYTPPAWLRLLVALAIRTGLRRKTLLMLEWGEVDLVSRPPYFHIHASKMKRRQEFHVPMCESLRGELRRYLGERVPEPTERIFNLHEDGVKRAFLSACRRAKLKLTFHDLRRCFINRHKRNGVPLETIMSLSDHVSYQTVAKHYLEVPEEERQAATRALDQAPAPPKGEQSVS